MTAVAVPPQSTEPTAAERLRVLRAALLEPDLIGFRTEILDAIEALTGVRPEEERNA